MKLLLSLPTLSILNAVVAQLPSHVTKIEAQPNKVTSVTGSMEDGQKIDDLSWASSSSTACFSSTQNRSRMIKTKHECTRLSG